jgi:Domain of unknown function (DUF4249)
MKPFLIALFALVAILSSCNLTKEVELDLPAYVGQPFVTCYLEPGKPFNLLLTESSSYFAPFDTGFAFITGQLIGDAAISISVNGMTYDLTSGLGVLLENTRVYNYINPTIVPADFDHDFELNITLADGRKIYGKTRMISPVQVDSFVYEKTGTDTLFRLLTYVTDASPDITNYFRRQLNFGSMDSLEQDFMFDDPIATNGRFVFGTGPSYHEGDTLISTFHTADKAYYDFWRSIEGAIQGNGNPFAQPGIIFSNVTGTADPIGIFTGLNYDRDTVYIGN